ncbi:MAG: hypothetical protein Kow0062_02110 [Acidobacteriota bacterium]|nr:MAG: hypothetical protein D6738_00415 [Acidobacteriota bacterium]
MRIYWSLRSIPELRSLDAEQRRRVWRRARANVPPDWRLVLGWLLFGVTTGGGFALGALPGALAGALLGAFLLLQIVTRQTLPYIRVDVARRHRGTVEFG